MSSLAQTASVNRKGATRWQRGHPWIFRSDLTHLPELPAGRVTVLGEGNRLLGTALWSPRSQISLRMLTRDDRVLDASFWRDRIATALAYRKSLVQSGNAYRMVHGEADGLPSLVVDRYGDYLVAQLLSAGLESYRSEISAALIELSGAKGLLARNDVSVRQAEGLPEEVVLLYGHVPEEVEIWENGIRYMAAPWSGQKTGAFLDQRDNRARIAQVTRGRALDCFSYHGSFALHLARLASEVTAVDSSGPALERARQNAQLNNFTNLRTVEANVFDFLRDQEARSERYDTIVIDPPAFAKRRDALAKALRAYKELNLRAMKLLNPGGILATFSCSHHVHRQLFREMLESAAADARRPMRWIEARSQALDHPEIVQIPESTYLKGAILQAMA